MVKQNLVAELNHFGAWYYINDKHQLLKLKHHVKIPYSPIINMKKYCDSNMFNEVEPLDIFLELQEKTGDNKMNLEESIKYIDDAQQHYHEKYDQGLELAKQMGLSEHSYNVVWKKIRDDWRKECDYKTRITGTFQRAANVLYFYTTTMTEASFVYEEIERQTRKYLDGNR